jgi:hypothetical protein
MVNLVSKIDQQEVNKYGISEAYFIDECFMLTCKNNITYSQIQEIKIKLDKSIISDVLDMLFSKESKGK